MTTYTYDLSELNDVIEDTDFAVECEDYQSGSKTSDDVYVFEIHKSVVRGTSEYLDALIDGGFQETQENRVRMRRNPSIIAIVLWSMYEEISRDSLYSDTPEILSEFVSVAERLDEGNPEHVVELYETVNQWSLPNLQTFIKELARNSFRPPDRGHPRYTEWTQQVEKALKYFFEDTPVIEEQYLREIRELLAHWVNHFYDQSLVEGWWNSLPDLGLYLYKDHVEQRKTRLWPCSNCKALLGSSDTVILIVNDVTDYYWEPKEVRCHCGFRGLCSDACRAGREFAKGFANLADRREGLLCFPCCIRDYLKGYSEFYLRDDGLGWGRGFKFVRQITNKNRIVVGFAKN